MYFFSTCHLAITSSLLLFLLSPTSVIAQSDPNDGYRDDLEVSGPPNCPLDPKLKMPDNDMDPPSKNLKLLRVAVGRGELRYTCSSAGSKPQYIGANASLTDASCRVGDADFSDEFIPSLLDKKEETVEEILPGLYFNYSPGRHWHTGAKKLAYFRVDETLEAKLSWAESSPAPSNARGNKWGPAVDWQRLVRNSDEPKEGIEEIYRVSTVGGRAPRKCKNKNRLDVKYVAVYWVYGSP